MAAYEFGPDERIVLRAQDVHLDGSRSPFFAKPELVLTNENIVYPRKGKFGKAKEYRIWPLSSIRIVDGVPQCRLDTSKFMEARLAIAFQDEVVLFEFRSLQNKEEIRTWINEISEILVGHEAEEDNLRTTGIGALTDGDVLFDKLGSALMTFSDTFSRVEEEAERRIGLTSRRDSEPDVATHCPSCNASIKGKRGVSVRCPYCDTRITLS